MRKDSERCVRGCRGLKRAEEGKKLRTKSAELIERVGQWSSRDGKKPPYITVSFHAGHYSEHVPYINSFHSDKRPHMQMKTEEQSAKYSKVICWDGV